MGAIYRRELKSYFTSIIGFVVISIMFCLSGIFFWLGNLLSGTTDMSGTFSSLFLPLIFVIPLLTMRIFSEDRRQKTDQALLTAPLSLIGLVMGKYLASVTVFLISISINFVFGIIINFYAAPDWIVIFGNFLGLFLMGAALIAVGMFFSALTESQVIAAITSLVSVLALFFLPDLLTLIPLDFVAVAARKISCLDYYTQFTMGIISVTGILFFVSLAAIFVYLTVKMMEKRRWG